MQIISGGARMRIVDRSIALKKLQQEELEILIEFSKFCERHGLTWFLDSGTKALFLGMTISM